MEDIVKNIKQKLTDLEKAHNIHIIYACESGSRAWGFASSDSDYDVRFIYVRSKNDYLKLESTPDFIEAELNEVYDINGWDITKFLKLVTKSNPTLFEWAASPIVYKTTDEWDKVSRILSRYFQASKMMYHYVSMAKNNVRTYFQGTEVKLKKYLYILRPVLACEWIMVKNCPPPTEFSNLVEGVLPKELTASVDELLKAKMKASEKDFGSRIPAIDTYIEQKITESLAFLESNTEKKEIDWTAVDNAFLEIIEGERYDTKRN